MYKEITIVTVVGDCKDCMFHTEDRGCIISGNALEMFNIPVCGATRNIYKIKEK